KYGEEYDIKVADWNEAYPAPGNFYLIDLGDGNKGDQLAGRVNNEISIVEPLNTLNTFPGNALTDFDDRISRSKYHFDENLAEGETYVPGTNFRAWEQDDYAMDARMLICPVFELSDMLDVDGRKKVEVVGFSVFFVDHYVWDPSDPEKTTISGYFVEAIYGEETYEVVNWLNNEYIPPGGNSVYVVRLVS
ncbi:MAG: hypothetical protein Q7N50_09465, partial [Armatimonadota bacterium]|nr:hypothetical protein [Armatimonadota bacterium]